MNLLLTSAIDVSIVLTVAFLLIALLRGRSAALRHWILAAAITGAAAMPALELALPTWDIALPSWMTATTTSGPVLTSNAPPDIASTSATTADTTSPRSSLLARPDLLILYVWFTGLAAGIAILLVGLLRLSRLERRAAVVREGPSVAAVDAAARAHGLRRPIRLLHSEHPALVVTWGLLRPKVLLPAGAHEWSDERLRVVLSHELAHVRRGDWPLQMLAAVLRCVYWFNPLVWIACRRFRLESERACDDAVLNAGVAPADYASHLLAVARDAVRLRHTWTPATAIAHPSTLEGRIRAMLNVSLDRNPLSQFARYAVVFTLGALAAIIAGAAVSATSPVGDNDVVLPGGVVQLRIERDAQPADPIEPATPPRAIVIQERTPPAASAARAISAAPAAAQQIPATLSGVLRDASGGVLPGVQLELTGPTGTRTAVSDGTGRFTFRDLLPSRYTLLARLPGFATATIELDVPAGATVERNLELRIGGLMETITVTCSSGAASIGRDITGVMASVARAPRDAPSLIYGTPREASAFAQVPPGKPVRVGGQIKAPQQIRNVPPICPGPPAADTIVILEATIGTDGLVKDIRDLRKSVPKEYVDAAMEAVRQWQYTPTLLNNVAVPVIMTVTVNFQRS